MSYQPEWSACREIRGARVIWPSGAKLVPPLNLLHRRWYPPYSSSPSSTYSSFLFQWLLPKTPLGTLSLQPHCPFLSDSSMCCRVTSQRACVDTWSIVTSCWDYKNISRGFCGLQEFFSKILKKKKGLKRSHNSTTDIFGLQFMVKNYFGAAKGFCHNTSSGYLKNLHWHIGSPLTSQDNTRLIIHPLS